MKNFGLFRVGDFDLMYFLIELLFYVVFVGMCGVILGIVIKLIIFVFINYIL